MEIILTNEDAWYKMLKNKRGAFQMYGSRFTTYFYFMNTAEPAL